MPTDLRRVRAVSRRLWDLIEPIASMVYFAPEAHSAYEALGLEGFGSGYFCSRAACMGPVPGEVVAATFAVFNPAVVVPAVADGWARTTPAKVLAAREEGAVTALRRLLGDTADDARLARATELLGRAGDAAPVSGRPLFAGLRSLGVPDDAIGAMWRTADVLREHRGDSHVIAWNAMALSAVEITLLTELWWHMASGRYIRTRGWGDDEIAAGVQSLRDRGFVDGDPPAFTPAGEELRAVIEEMTDGGETAVVEALGGDAEELFELLAPWTDAVLAAKGYPRDPSSIGRP